MGKLLQLGFPRECLPWEWSGGGKIPRTPQNRAPNKSDNGNSSNNTTTQCLLTLNSFPMRRGSQSWGGFLPCFLGVRRKLGKAQSRSLSNYNSQTTTHLGPTTFPKQFRNLVSVLTIILRKREAP